MRSGLEIGGAEKIRTAGVGTITGWSCVVERRADGVGAGTVGDQQLSGRLYIHEGGARVCDSQCEDGTEFEVVPYPEWQWPFWDDSSFPELLERDGDAKIYVTKGTRACRSRHSGHRPSLPRSRVRRRRRRPLASARVMARRPSSIATTREFINGENEVFARDIRLTCGHHWDIGRAWCSCKLM